MSVHVEKFALFCSTILHYFYRLCFCSQNAEGDSCLLFIISLRCMMRNHAAKRPISANTFCVQAGMLIDFLIVYLWVNMFFCRSGKVVFAATVYRQKIPTCTWSDNWCGVWGPHDNNWWETNQTPDMGYCWTGGVSFDNEILLQGCCGSPFGLRYYEEGDLQSSNNMARRCSTTFQL